VKNINHPLPLPPPPAPHVDVPDDFSGLIARETFLLGCLAHAELQSDHPDYVSFSQMFADLAAEFREAGYQTSGLRCAHRSIRLAQKRTV
jgi:hypothetical protein